MQKSKTLLDKVWESHVVHQEQDSPAILYIDLHLIHEVTSPQAFSSLSARGLRVRRPDKTFATIDHALPTLTDDVSNPRARLNFADEASVKQIQQLEDNANITGIRLFGLGDPNLGIVHVIGPEQGLTQPGMTIVCGDSHTATHGAFGSLAFGIGTSEVEHVLATQTLLQNKPKSFEIRVDGSLSNGVTSKDIILKIIEMIGIGGGTGYVLEYTGSAIRSLNMEARMTVCNMSIEGGARAGMIAPDDITFEYLSGKKYAPKDKDWDQAVDRWRKLSTEEGAVFDRSLNLDVSDLEPMVTFGTNPGMAMPITSTIPSPDKLSDPTQKSSLVKALKYMDFQPGRLILGQAIDVVFIGSCTNSRISDLRLAAELLKGRKTSESTRVLIVPGSEPIKKQAEAEGLDKIFLEAGAEWREPGCSMCIAMNGDQIQPGEYAVSTSNRNFEGRQGKGGRTILASPLTAAAAAITGKLTDPRTLMQ
ncbi:MAG: 3-isopropylmalate dehydratase large subunit [Anaerolineaceae bacterium]|nr:3-isopropylmalate dehydratase large subunit [Anaerolineaceae bacterium]